MAALQVLSRNAETAIGLGPGGETDHVIVPGQIVELEVRAKVDVAEETEGGPLCRPVELLCDLLDLLVIRRDPEPHQTKRRRQPLEHVDRDLEPVTREQPIGGEERRRPRTNDGDSERRLCWHGHDMV